MSDKKFVHLHVHSHYSLLDGLSRPETYAKKAVEQGAPAVALTDHGVMHGGIEFYKACKKLKIKPVIGCEVYIAFNKLTDKRHQIDNKRTHCVLLAETQEGYENLLHLTTTAHLEGYYYKPRVDWDLLRQHSKGLIALSACLHGDLPQAILSHDDEKIKELIQRFIGVFGKNNFFLELQDHPSLPQQQTVNDRLIELGKEYGLPLVATNDCHYANYSDNEAQDIMLCIQTGKNINDAGRMSMMNSDYSMRSPEEMWQAFGHVPEALENTLKIAERCTVEFEFGKYRIPSFPTPDNKDPVLYLKELCYKGMAQKFELPHTPEELMGRAPVLTDEEKALADRLDFELKVIMDMGFVGYFLIVWDYVKWAKDHEIVVGPGRGSAAGALVSYSLDITEIDPLKYKLLFERFLNPARISMPDIDLDFADNRRDEVINYVAQKYGRDHVAQICTFGTMAARAAVKDVGRVLGVPFSEMNEFAKLIPEKPGTTLEEALEQSPELKQQSETSDIFKQVMANALKLEGAVRHVSVHACAVLIGDRPLTCYTALQHPPKDESGVITQYEAHSLEALGLLKMDFLGLKNLTILQTALKIIERTKGKKINLKKISIEDKKTYGVLARGETTGVFQLESSGMKRYLKELRPTEFEDIIAMVSLYRPGPMEWIPDYIKGKHNPKAVHYLHPSLEPILRTTYGIAIYQEQILQIAQAFSGFSLGEADLLRRAIGKKIASELEAQKEKFINGAVNKGFKRELAVMIFEKVVEPFAGYGFNKSHAACYAMIAYETAYLKAHYPTEFMTALMSADYGNTDRIVIEIGECDQMGIRVLPPDVNESLSKFTYVEDGKIRFGLSAIKGLGDESVRVIIEAREKEGKFKSIEDFARRVPAKVLNKKSIEALAMSGALDCLGERKQIALNYELVAEFGKKSESSHIEGQAGLFDNIADSTPIEHLELPKVEPATQTERLKWEKDFLGLYVSSHPLAGLKKYFQRKLIPLDQLASKTVGKPIKVGGLLTSFRKVVTKKGDNMAMLTIEDPFGKVDAVMFPKTYTSYSGVLVDDQVLIVEGTLEKRNADLQIIVNKATAVPLDKLQAVAKKDGFWTEGETIDKANRQELDEESEVEKGEETQVLKQVQDDKSVKANPEPIASGTAGLENPKQTGAFHTILVNREVGKAFFLELRKLLEQHPGKQRVQLKIGEKILPLPMAVDLTPELLALVESMMKS